MIDRYANVTLHHEKIDWSSPKLSADSITSTLIGSCAYWDHDDFEGMGPHEIEKDILFSAGRDQWHLDSPYGKPYYQHFLTLMKVLFPKTDITPSIADAVLFFCLGLGFKKILNLIGSQNAGKSAGAVRIVFVAMYIDPEYTVVSVANPFDNAADSTVWGDVEELWDELCETWPCEGKKDVPSLFPNGVKYANKRLEFIPNLPKAGRIELKNVKHVGKYKGSKTRGKQTDRGVMFVIVDEINEIDNYSFLTTLENISSQDAFFAITSQNFKDEEDMGGQITSPVPKFGGPENFSDLNVETDLFWHSAKASITLRFDGHRAPNILAGRIIYPYLLKQTDLNRLSESGGGEQSMTYYSQVRSFPIRGSEVTSVLSKAKTSASRHLDPHYQLQHIKGTVAFCDPAFGGQDSAVYGFCKFGMGTVLDSGGVAVDQELMVFTSHMVKLKFVNEATYNDYWFERMRAAGISTNDFVLGSEVSPEDQVAIQCAELNRQNGVVASNFGYDFSMRPDIVSSMNRIIGFSTVAFDYNQGPSGVFLRGIKQESTDYCHDRVTELAFLTADLFLTKQVRGGEFIDTAIVQLQRTLHEPKNKKRKAEKKAEYKSRWQGRSPDERDVLMGLAGLAVTRGFRSDSLKNSSGNGGISPFSSVLDTGAGRSRIARPLR
jgi:hypothetical protein